MAFWIWLIADVAVKAAVLLMLIGLIAGLFVRQRPALRTLLWHQALMALLLLPIASVTLPTLRLPALPMDVVPDHILPGVPLVFQGAVVSVDIQAVQGDRVDLPEPVDRISTVATAWNWMDIALGIYLTGVGICLFRLSLGWWRVCRLRRSVCRFAGPELLARLDRWCVRLGISDRIDLGISDRIQVPTVVGVFGPLILIPAHLAEKGTDGDWDGILIHELAHVKRRDALWNMLGLLVAAVYWYHPLVHWALRELSRARECACDDWAVSVMNDREGYARTLLEVTARTDRRLSQAMGLDMARTAHVLQRVNRLLNVRIGMAPDTGYLISGLSGIVMATCAALLGSVRPSHTDLAAVSVPAMRETHPAGMAAFDLEHLPADVREEWAQVYGYRALRHDAKPEVVARYRDMLWAYVNRTDHRHPGLLAETYRELFRALRDDAGTRPEALLQVVKGMAEYEQRYPHIAFGEGPMVLAERTSYYREAEAIVRRGFETAAEWGKGSGDREVNAVSPQGVQLTAIIYNALGWVYFNEGRFAEAEIALLQAHRLHAELSHALYHLGRLYEQLEDWDRAEHFYMSYMERTVWKVSDDMAARLKALYQGRYGGLAGFDGYLKKVQDRAELRHKEAVLSERLLYPLPAFDLLCIDGTRISSGMLQGKVVVIDTGIRVYEKHLLDAQALQAHFTEHQNVVVLHINRDTRLAEIARQHGAFKFLMAVDTGPLSEVGMTYFLDRQGRVVFESRGRGPGKPWVKESTWRVEALLVDSPVN